MDDNKHISPNDPDLILAQRIGEALPALESLETDDAPPLLSHLIRFKLHYKQSVKSPDSEKIWSSIENTIERDNTSAAKIFKLTPALKRIAIAASFLLVALMGSLIYQKLSGPELIRESFAQIEHIELSDGSKITLRPYSKLFEHTSNSKQQIYSIEGEAYFEVTPNPDRVFAVKTQLSQVKVLGTKFMLSHRRNTSTVYLEEGRIQYSSLKNQQKVILSPGQSSKIDESSAIPSVMEANQKVFKDWLQDELVFENESAELVFRELEHHFNIKIEYRENLEHETLSGSLQLTNLPAVLRDMELVLNGSFTQTDDHTYTFKMND